MKRKGIEKVINAKIILVVTIDSKLSNRLELQHRASP